MAYIEYNVNPKHRKVGDCAIRAIAIATGLGWDDAYKLLANTGFNLKCAMSDTEAINEALISYGFIAGKIEVQKGSKRPTVSEFATLHPNWYSVLRVANHITACGHGNYVDIWDCGDKSVYKYWYKPIREE